MTYEDFLDMLKEKANEELGFELDKMTFYPKGYTSMDPQTREWINDCNRRFSGDKSGTLSDGILMEDFLSMETPLGSISASFRRTYRQRMSNRSSSTNEIAEIMKRSGRI